MWCPRRCRGDEVPLKWRAFYIFQRLICVEYVQDVIYFLDLLCININMLNVMGIESQSRKHNTCIVVQSNNMISTQHYIGNK